MEEKQMKKFQFNPNHTTKGQFYENFHENKTFPFMMLSVSPWA